MANICQGVHGPCPNRKLLTSMVIAPTRNPASPPKAIPLIITMAVTGLILGTIKNAALPAQAKAAMVARTIISLA